MIQGFGAASASFPASYTEHVVTLRWGVENTLTLRRMSPVEANPRVIEIQSCSGDLFCDTMHRFGFSNA